MYFLWRGVILVKNVWHLTVLWHCSLKDTAVFGTTSNYPSFQKSSIAVFRMLKIFMMSHLSVLPSGPGECEFEKHDYTKSHLGVWIKETLNLHVLLTFRFLAHNKDIDKCACMCAKSLQPCPTLCNPMDCSPPGFSVSPFCGLGIWAELRWEGDSSDPCYVYQGHWKVFN